jgi:hypothetical protein
MLHNFEPTKNKKQKRWGRTEDKNIISSGSLSYLLSAIKQHNPNFLFTTWKSNHWVSSFYFFFFC